MKNCQEKKEQKNKSIFYKNFYNFLIVVILIIGCLFFIQNMAQADFTPFTTDPSLSPGYSGAESLYSDVFSKNAIKNAIKTVSEGTEAAVNKGTEKDWKGKLKDWAIDKAWKGIEKATAIGYKKALSYFLNELAYNTAVYLATGDKGQTPMFETDDIGDFLEKTADNAAGYFIESLGKNDYLKFNLCKPDFDVQLKISLGLSKYKKPTAPKCTFSKMVSNWNEALKSPDFLNDFQDMFNPWSNDLAIALSMQTGFLSEIEKEKTYKGLSYEINRGIHAVIDPISHKVKTPSSAVETQMNKTINRTDENYYVYTGDAVADAIGVFVNTLSGKLMERWLKEGLVTNFPSDSSDSSDYNYAYSGGTSAAQERFKNLMEPNFSVRGDYDILSELSICPDPTNAGPTNCVITDNFRQAIINRVTVGQAMTQGYLNKNGIFGFSADGLEPSYNEGYSYRSMIILRKFRILPVGWELAAQYIKDNPTAIDGTKNLGDLVACYSANDDYGGYYANWCDGLVDPTWVLKAPLNYCKREGAGPDIISEQVTGSGYNSKLSVLRDDVYCADEQSCIQENIDGSCNLYGYCTEERRTWNFNANSCDPIYNTCQTFRDSAGQTISYLENTLDYSSCVAENVGCLDYCQDYDYESGDYTCTSNDGDKIYLNGNAEACAADVEGCHEFIRTKAGLGVNILTNSSFEDDIDGSVWAGAGSQVYDGYVGSRGLRLSSNLSKIITFGLSNYDVAGQYFSLSFYAKDCGLGDSFSLGGQNAISLNQGEDWQYYNTSYIYPEDTSTNQISFSINSDSCIIDAIKLERGQMATTYGDYRDQGLVYQKLAPDYLSCAGVNDPSACDDFARVCSADEAGCELYTAVSDNTSVAAKVMAQDYCPSECVGYDVYLQSETIFDSLRDSYFIPTTAQVCDAEAVGCDEFTNLDEVERGGEAREYYSYLRQCISASDSQCAEFYTWQGSDEAGYQLKVMVLKKSQITGEPAVTEDDYTECNEAIYNLDATDPSYNSDCRQFYNRNGQVSYHLYTHTVSCSDNCHPYRRTQLNVDPEIALSAECAGADKYWDAATAQCVVCKNGGVWNNEHQACLYMAIPGEGKACAASQAGCREYSGNTGNNMRFILNDNFEGSLQNWTGENGATVNLSNESLVAGGNSLEISTSPFTISKTVGRDVYAGKAYVLTFNAKAGSASKITSVQLANSAKTAEFTTADLVNDWRYYKVNLANLDHAVLDDEKIIIVADGSFYLDDIRLTEITDRYYFIKNSWVTPDSCNRDIEGRPAPLYMLGCEAYQDRDNKIHNLHNFSHLCNSSAVGCELMIDTHNYRAYSQATFNLGDASEITVPADNYAYVVYDADKSCNSSDKGCQRLGNPYRYGDDLIYSDVYLKNNPDNYNEILCGADGVGCQAWTSDTGVSYFKDPGNMVCQWRQAANTTEQGWGWYKKKVKRCGGDGGAICLADIDCSGEQTCQTETVDLACPTTLWKTFSYGGAGTRVYQPDGDWAGLCSASQSGCTEYIDPVSKFSSNIIFNSNLESPQDVDLNNIPDGWVSSDSGFQQGVTVEPYTLYRLGRTAAAGSVSLVCNDKSYVLGADNRLSSGVTTITVDAEAYDSSKIIYTAGNESCAISVSNAAGQVELKPVAINYQLENNVDKQGCNGVVNFEDGCVLFNERGQDGSNLANLTWDADLTASDQSGVTPIIGLEDDRDANLIIKVEPDRICDKWLACRSYIKDENDNNVCFDIGLCNGVDPNGNCSSFLMTDQENQIYPSVQGSSGIANLSGYSKVGYAGSSIVSDYYNLGAMNQDGEMAQISNNGFEIAGTNGYPLGWIYESGSWNQSVFKVINNPIETQTEGIGYAPEGQNFLKLGSSYSATSEFVDVVGGTTSNPIEYVVTVYMNTINLKSGSAKMKIGLYDSAGHYLADAAMSPEISLKPGYDWVFKLSRFSIMSANVSRIKITLYADAGAEGNYYFDDIQIKPALNSRADWYTPQSCRLYPETDSLSCDYYDDSGKRQKGWFGYCLEYDRYPGSEDACLLWWPVDKVKGEGIEEGAGYTGKIPVYYCTETTLACGNESYCKNIVQTVTSVGNNKYWSSRVYEGSDYIISENTIPEMSYKYNDIAAPFGSVAPPNPTNNPYEWDGDFSTVSNDPLYYFPGESNSVNQGQIYQYDRNSCSNTFLFDGGMGMGAFSNSNKGILGYWDNCTTSGYTDDTSATWFGSLDYYMPSGFEVYDFVVTYSASDPSKFSVGYYDTPIGKYWVTKGGDGDGGEGVIFSASITCSSTNDKPGPSIELLKRIFAQNYGTWQWDSSINHYISVGGYDWGPPASTCPGNIRPDYPNDYCAVVPSIFNIEVNEKNGNVEVVKNQFVNLTFNTLVDSQQLPLVMYAIDWGDDEDTVVTGVEMRSRPSDDNPHSMYHLYSYWDLKAKSTRGVSGIDCSTDGECRVKPKVKIKDNWGWCNGGTAMNDCDQWTEFGGWIVVQEK